MGFQYRQQEAYSWDQRLLKFDIQDAFNGLPPGSVLTGLQIAKRLDLEDLGASAVDGKRLQRAVFDAVENNRFGGLARLVRELGPRLVEDHILQSPKKGSFTIR